MKGREFILAVNSKFSISSDPHFNSYDPNYKDPLWKATIKKIIGWEKTEIAEADIIENSVIKNFRKSIKFEKTKGGAISIAVTHLNPQKASYYANIIMEELRQLVERKAMLRKTCGSLIFQKP